MSKLTRALGQVSAALAVAVASCGGSGGSTPATAESLSGTVFDSDGAGLADVIVTVFNVGATQSAEATTDATGNFVVLSPPSGTITVDVDPSGVAPGLGNFPHLELVDMIGNGAATLSQAIVLPDLNDGGTASLTVGAGGQTMGAGSVVAPDGTTLDIPDMTTITLGGVPATVSVDVNVTPVAPANVPMPLPDSLDAGSFVTIQPGNGGFSPALGITLPNSRGFADGTMVDIWSFDHDEGDWVNRSAQSGQQGVVMDVMGNSRIVATGVITEGGWHAGALPVDPTCATTLTGRVQAQGTSTPVDNVLISLGTGQFARTDDMGLFTIDLVPAYDAGQLPTCVAVDIFLVAVGSVADGANRVTLTVPAGNVTPGGTTDIGNIDLPVADVGSVAGSVTENGNPVGGTVTIAGPVNTTALAANGAFFRSNLTPGAYTAAFDFTSGTVTVPFTIVAGETTLVTLASNPPTSGGTVNVQVLSFDSDITLSTGVPVPDACVTLQGGTGAALFATTNASGIAAFSNAPNGPYTATAQLEITDLFGATRVAVSVVGVTPTGSPKTIVLPSFFDGAFDPPIGDATFDGSVMNAPVGANLEYQVSSVAAAGFFDGDDLFGTNFSSSVPSGALFDAAVTAVDSVTGSTLSSVILRDLTVASGQTLASVFDFNGACDFDSSVAVSYSNEPPTGGAEVYLYAVGAGDLEFPIFTGTDFPATVDVPDLSNAKLTGAEVFLEFTNDGFAAKDFESTYCFVPIGPATPVSLNVSFLGYPTITSPMEGANFPTFGPANTVNFTLGAGNGVTSGFNNVLFISTFEDNGSVVVTFWDIFLSPTTTSTSVPQVFPTKPMFGEGISIASVIPLRFTLPGFDFPTFFDGDLLQNVMAVELSTTCSAATANFFTVGNPQFLTSGDLDPHRLRKLERTAKRRMR